MILQEEKQFEDPAHYAIPSVGGNWGNFLSKGLKGVMDER
jgi:hypothetical protein